LIIKKEDICLVGYAAVYYDRNLPRLKETAAFVCRVRGI
jgi:hypothetical protein